MIFRRALPAINNQGSFNNMPFEGIEACLVRFTTQCKKVLFMNSLGRQYRNRHVARCGEPGILPAKLGKKFHPKHLCEAQAGKDMNVRQTYIGGSG